MSTEQIRTSKVVKEVCRETVLCLGRIFAVHEVPDDVVWQAARSLDIIFQKALAKVSKQDMPPDEDVPERKLEPHPAIQGVLERLEED